MQKQQSELLFSWRLLLTLKRYAVHSRHLHSPTVKSSISIDRLALWSSANRSSTRTCSEDVTGLHRKMEIRRESTMEKAISADKDKHIKAPWHREGSDIPPVARQRSAGAMIKGSRVSLRAATLTDLRLRKAFDNTLPPSQAHHTSHHA